MGVIRLVIKVEEISGIGQFIESTREEKEGVLNQLFSTPEGRVFLVIRPKTLEVRCDAKLKNLLREKYESVMEGRYFGRGGIEIVDSGQLSDEEVEDLIRLSYNLSREMGGTEKMGEDDRGDK